MLLTLIAVAVGSDLSCEEVLGMFEIGLPEEAVLEAVAGSTMTQDESQCVQDADLPEAVKAWALQAVPVESVEETAAPVDPVDEEDPYARELREARAARDRARGTRLGSAYDICMDAAPDPGIAALLSGTAGFGSGHFYAEQPRRGAILVFAQAATLGTMMGSVVILSDSEAYFEPSRLQTGVALFYGGALATLALHGIDAGTAAQSARQTRERYARECSGAE